MKIGPEVSTALKALYELIERPILLKRDEEITADQLRDRILEAVYELHRSMKREETVTEKANPIPDKPYRVEEIVYRDKEDLEDALNRMFEQGYAVVATAEDSYLHNGSLAVAPRHKATVIFRRLAGEGGGS